MYSDGVTEAFDPHQEMFGEARLAKVVADAANHSALAILESIAAGVAAFTADAPQSDDLTLSILKVDPPAKGY